MQDLLQVGGGPRRLGHRKGAQPERQNRQYLSKPHTGENEFHRQCRHYILCSAQRTHPVVKHEHATTRDKIDRDDMLMVRSLRVLLVEDSKVLTERLTEAIRQISDVELIGTADTEAAALAAVKRDSVDVIILDLHLKQGTGFGVMRALATTQQKPRIIVLTNYDLPEYKNAAIALGATHFLDKARDYGRLPEVLHEICEAHLAKH